MKTIKIEKRCEDSTICRFPSLKAGLEALDSAYIVGSKIVQKSEENVLIQIVHRFPKVGDVVTVPDDTAAALLAQPGNLVSVVASPHAATEA